MDAKQHQDTAVDEIEIADLRSERQISRVLADFCVAVDRMDWELLASCFHPDAYTQFGIFVDGNVSEYLSFVQSDRGLPSFDRTMHNLGTCTIDVEGDVANARTYCVAYHSAPADHPWCKGFVVFWARYIDRFERRDDRWAIASRVCSVEWARNLTTGEEIEHPTQLRGRRDRTDQHYTR